MTDDNGRTKPATRRNLLAGAGALGAAVVLAACGSDDEPTGSASTSPNLSSDGVGDDSDLAGGLVDTADVPVGGGVILATKGVVITQPTAGVFKGFSSVCTHQQCPVSRINGSSIVCTCHNSKFSIEDGSVQGGPAKQPLPAKEIVVDNDRIRLA